MPHHRAEFLSLVLLVVGLLSLSQSTPSSQSNQTPSPPTPSPDVVAFTRELMEAATDDARRALLDGRGALVGVELRRFILDEGMRLFREGQFDRGLVGLRTSRDIAARLQDRGAIAAADSRIAQVLAAKGEYDEALAILRACEATYRDLNDTRSLLQVLNNEAIVHRRRGELHEALALQQRILAVHEANAETASLGITLNNIGAIQLDLGEFRAAIASFQRSLGYRKPGTAEYAGTLHNLGSVYHAQGDLSVARGYYERALETPGVQATLRMNMLTMAGEVTRRLGQFDAAEAYAQQGVQLAEQSGARPMLANALRILALVHDSRGESDRAVAELERSLAVAKSAKDPEAIGYALANLGAMHVDRRDYARGLAAAEEAIALGDALTGRGQVQAYQTMGLAQAGLRHPAEARRAFEAAVARVEDLREQVSGAAVERQQFLERYAAPLHKLIELSIDQQQDDDALGYAERARARTLVDVIQRGHVTLASRLTPAERREEATLEQRLRAAQRAAPERADAPPTPVAPSGRPQDARAGSERRASADDGATAANARSSGDRAAVSASAPDDAVEAARRELAALRVRLYAAHPELRLARGDVTVPTRADLGAAILDSSTAVLAYTVSQSRAWLFVLTTPSTARPGPRPAPSTATVRARAAVDASAGRGASGETLARQPELQVIALPMDAAALTGRVRQFREALATRDLGFTAQARALYDDLLGPAGAAIAGKTRIILVPDGALWELPFQALRSPRQRFLLEEAAIAYAPSLTYLYEHRRQRAGRDRAAARTTSLDLLVLGNPTRDDATTASSDAPTLGAGAGTARVVTATTPPARETTASAAADASKDSGGGTTPRQRPSLPSLPRAEEQARRVAALYPAERVTTLIGSAAREARVKQDAGRYRILHFATHGLLDDGNPLYSSLLLASEAEGAAEDGRLEARELMDLPLAADLVVLSACDTARGRIGAGEGVVGLAWSLLVAGSASTVVSQWEVDADSTSDLMIAFHRALRRTPPASATTATTTATSATTAPRGVDGALRAAALAVMRDPRYRHPFYWAAFRVVGAPDAVATGSR